MNRHLGLFTLGTALILAWPGTAGAQQVTKVRATQVGDSDWIRVDWSADATNPAVQYEIHRTTYQPGKAPETTLVGVTSGRPDVRVFVDKGPKETTAEYGYEARPVTATGVGSCVGVPARWRGPIVKEVARHLDFDDGRLPNRPPFRSISHPAAPGGPPPWILRDGRLDWLPGGKSATSRLTLDLDAKAKSGGAQITARIAILGDLPEPNCADSGVGVGLMAAGGTRIVSLVVRKAGPKTGPDANRVSIHFLHESMARETDPPAGTPRANPIDADPKEFLFDLPDRPGPDPGPAQLTWLWLKMTVDGGAFKGKAWLDSDDEPKGWAIETKAFENKGWDDVRAVLIGGSGATRASFGEVFIERTRSAAAPTVADGGRNSSKPQPDAAPAPVVCFKPEDAAEEARKARLSAAPFNDLPTIIRLVARGSLRPEERDQVEDAPPELGTAEDPARHFDFASAAHFPWPRFDECDDEAGDEGVVIYEGMRLDVASDGHYEVRFVATTPATPVTLRLQFRLEQRDGSERTVTIPAIDIRPPTDNRGRYQAATWKIRHQGYSYNLAWVPTTRIRDSNGKDQLREDGFLGARVADYRIARRVGTARFGSRPSPAY